MNELTIEPYTNAIITYSKSHYLLTEKQHNALQEAGSGDSIEIDGNKISVNNIAEILTIQKYYETYPEKRPVPKSNAFDKYESIVKTADSRNGLASLIKGLKRFIDEQNAKNIKTPKAQYELDRMVKKYELRYGR